MSVQSNITDFELIMKSVGIEYETEYKFHPTRRWRFDYAIPDKKIAIEIEGGIWTRGRHTRGAGYIKDIEKYNAAVELGWYLFRLTYEHIKNGYAYTILEAIKLYEKR